VLIEQWEKAVKKAARKLAAALKFEPLERGSFMTAVAGAIAIVKTYQGELPWLSVTVEWEDGKEVFVGENVLAVLRSDYSPYGVLIRHGTFLERC